MGKSGFSLLEILIVIAIILILAGSLTPLLSSSKADARTAKVKADLDAIKSAANMCFADTGFWPAEGNTGADITTDVSAFVGWAGPYIDDWREDPWGRKYAIKDGVDDTRYVASEGPTAGWEAAPAWTTNPLAISGDEDVAYMITPDHDLTN